MPQVGLTRGRQAGGVAPGEPHLGAAPGALPVLSVWDPVHLHHRCTCERAGAARPHAWKASTHATSSVGAGDGCGAARWRRGQATPTLRGGPGSIGYTNPPVANVAVLGSIGYTNPSTQALRRGATFGGRPHPGPQCGHPGPASRWRSPGWGSPGAGWPAAMPGVSPTPPPRLGYIIVYTMFSLRHSARSRAISAVGKQSTKKCCDLWC